MAGACHDDLTGVEDLSGYHCRELVFIERDSGNHFAGAHHDVLGIQVIERVGLYVGYAAVALAQAEEINVLIGLFLHQSFQLLRLFLHDL